MITIEKLRYRRLSIEHLHIGPGMTGVIGPNGSGKTTLLKLLAGITLPESGSIRIDGIPPRNAGIGWVNEFPDRNILFGSVFEEIASPLRFCHLPCRATDERVKSIMASVGITHLLGRSMQELSGGEKVLVALAAALVTRPQLLVLDEYDAHLDGRRAREISHLIRNSQTPYVIFCTQDTETAASADAVVFLEGGRVGGAGTPQEVFASRAGTAFYPLSWRCRT